MVTVIIYPSLFLCYVVIGVYPCLSPTAATASQAQFSFCQVWCPDFPVLPLELSKKQSLGMMMYVGSRYILKYTK